MIVESYFEGKEYVKLSVNGNKKALAEDKVIEKIIQEEAPEIIEEKTQKIVLKKEVVGESSEIDGMIMIAVEVNKIEEHPSGQTIDY